MKIRDIILLPQDFYRKLNDSRAFLYIGMLLVGLRDVGLYLYSHKSEFAPMRLQDVVLGRLYVVLGFVILAGIIDVIFFSYPIHDLLKVFKRREENQETSFSVIRLMKIYILANMIVTPIDILILYFYTPLNPETASLAIIQLLMVASLLGELWYFAIITRGAAILFDFKNKVAVPLIFVLVYVYGYLLNYAFDFIYHKGLMTLLK